MNWWINISISIKPTITLAGIEIAYYGVFVSLGLLLGTLVAVNRAHLYQFNRNDVESAILWAFIPAIIGARIYHVIDNLPYFLLHPFDMVAVWKGGLAIYGALIGGIIGLLYASHKQQIKLLALLDLLAPSVALAQAIGRWGNFFNMEGYGPPTDLPWKIYISPARRVAPYFESDFFHPLFLYESIVNLLIFVLLILVARRKPISGVVAGGYLILYGLSRFVIEFGRLDTAMVSGVKIAHVFSGIAILLGLGLIFSRHLRPLLLKFSSK